MSATLYSGDALDVLRTLPDGAARCCVTSPPYWGLRDYGVAGQLGLEPTPEAYVAKLVEVFREVRRVLADDGTLWLNLGDSYNNAGSSRNGEGLDGVRRGGATGAGGALGYKRRDNRHSLGAIKHKDLVGIPWRVAFALQADGWWLRSDIIWAKPNPMPESVTDRPTRSHEYVFLLSKASRYYYDADAIAEKASFPGDNRALRFDTRKALDPMCADGGSRSRTGNPTGDTRNARSVWEIATQPYAEAHFATFPEELARRCILAGSSQAGGCPKCGRPWERVSERDEQPEAYPDRKYDPSDPRYATKRNMGARYQAELNKHPKITTGWQPTCECGEEPVPDVILDPFGGSGTVAQVATGNGRGAIHIDLNPAYLEMARQRIGPMLCEPAA